MAFLAPPACPPGLSFVAFVRSQARADPLDYLNHCNPGHTLQSFPLSWFQVCAGSVEQSPRLNHKEVGCFDSQAPQSSHGWVDHPRARYLSRFTPALQPAAPRPLHAGRVPSIISSCTAFLGSAGPDHGSPQLVEYIAAAPATVAAAAAAPVAALPHCSAVCPSTVSAPRTW